MSRRPLWLALALVLAVNAVVLAGVVRNRAGASEAALTLTERELGLSVGHSRDENNGVAFELDWNAGEFPLDWFDQAKLAELGFDAAQGSDTSAPHFRAIRALPKKAFVALEYEGTAWERYKIQKEQELSRLQEDLRQGKIETDQAEVQRAQLEGSLRAGSRLFAVDAGTDPEKLRERYPDRGSHIIVPAMVRANEQWEEKRRVLRGHVSAILTDTFHVPRDLHAPLLALPAQGRLSRYQYYQPGDNQHPRYEVQVKWGKRYEPWVAGVSLID